LIILGGDVDDLIKSSEGNKLIPSNKSDLNGNRTINYVLKNDARKLSIKGKIIFIQTNLIQLAVAYE